MSALAPHVTAEQVLQTFRQDAPYLFLGAAFVAVGLISAAFSLLRHKHDSVLNYFALFSVLYGLRLWIQANLLGLAIHGSVFYPRLAAGINYLVPIPAFRYFDAAGLLHRGGKIVGYGLEVILAVLAALTFAFGPSPTL
jgi:sigma-B regulation protein RsbU (phosphoserine phosphatase)